jgi:hypothetical protein
MILAARGNGVPVAAMTAGLSSANADTRSYGIETAAFGYDLENGSWAVTLDPPPATTPLPGALPLFVAGLTVIGFLTRKGRNYSSLMPVVATLNCACATAIGWPCD